MTSRLVTILSTQSSSRVSYTFQCSNHSIRQPLFDTVAYVRLSKKNGFADLWWSRNFAIRHFCEIKYNFWETSRNLICVVKFQGNVTKCQKSKSRLWVKWFSFELLTVNNALKEYSMNVFYCLYSKLYDTFRIMLDNKNICFFLWTISLANKMHCTSFFWRPFKAFA
jgi:hypothetical protein